MNSLIPWILLRIITSIFSGIVSSIKPILPIESQVQIFPPSIPLGTWLQRVFLSPWDRWDAEWYQRIITQGYSPTDGTAQFHPLYPWLAIPLARMGVSPILSLLIVSSLAGIFLFYFFKKLAQMDLPLRETNFALLLLALAPLSFILFSPYPEALFLLLAVLCVYFARNKSWWLSGLMGALATLTRQQGLFLLIPLAWELREYTKTKSVNFIKLFRDWSSLLLIPVGYLLWLAYRGIYLHDLSINTNNFQSFIYSFLISPTAANVVNEQKFLWPWQSLSLIFNKLIEQPDLDIWVNIIISTIFIVLLAIAWRKMRLSYRFYSLGIVLISFSYYTGTVHPTMGLPRHLFLAFPIFIGIAAVFTKPWQRILIVGLSALLMLFSLGLYVLHAWVP